MKKNLKLVVLLTIFAATCHAQSYKLKKGILTKDKASVAQIEGKVSLAKTDLTIKTMDGDVIFTAIGESYSSGLPEVKPIVYYNCTFPAFDKALILEQKLSFFGEKQFLKWIFEKNNVHFYSDGLHEDELNSFEDYTEQLQKDTLKVLETVNYFKETLAIGSISRDTSEPVTFGSFEAMPGIAIIQGYDDSKDPIIIGKIVVRKNEGTSISDPARAFTVKVYKKLPKTVKFNGEYTNFVIAGYIDMFDTIPELFLYQDAKSISHLDYRVDKSQTGQTVGRAAAKYLNSNGYL